MSYVSGVAKTESRAETISPLVVEHEPRVVDLTAQYQALKRDLPLDPPFRIVTDDTAFHKEPERDRGGESDAYTLFEVDESNTVFLEAGREAEQQGAIVLADLTVLREDKDHPVNKEAILPLLSRVPEGAYIVTWSEEGAGIAHELSGTKGMILVGEVQPQRLDELGYKIAADKNPVFTPELRTEQDQSKFAGHMFVFQHITFSEPSRRKM